MEFKVEFVFERETKNTYRFKETSTAGQPTRIGTLYLSKWNFAKQPATITVTVQAPD